MPEEFSAEGASPESSTPGSVDEALAAAQRALGTITPLLARSQIAAQQMSEDRAAGAAVLADLQSKANEISNIATLATAAKSKVIDEQAVIAEKSSHIHDAQEHADQVRADLDRARTAVTQQVTDIEGLGTRTQATADGAAALLAEVRTTKGAIENDAAAVAESRNAVKEHEATTKALADKAAVIEQRLATYEAGLARLKAESDAHLSAIVELLPGATSAGLASAFDKRRQTFVEPRKRWQFIFVGSLIVLIFVAGSAMYQVVIAADKSFEELLLLWLARVPVAGALVWLALHASHESALAKRLEEDYGYKAAIASSFQGFQKQMNEVGTSMAAESPLARLCSDTLATIASPPGRIYDKHRDVATPTAELTDTAKTLLEQVARVKQS